MAKKNCSQSIHIEDASELCPEVVRAAHKIGITAGASTPDGIIEEVKRTMSENAVVARSEQDFEEMLNGILTMELPNEDIRKDMLAQLAELKKEMPTNSPAPAKKPKVGRNDPCPCGSGKKYKKCCGK